MVQMLIAAALTPYLLVQGVRWLHDGSGAQNAGA
jgi:hypothetical protein